MATFFNQATLSYNDNVTNSNIVTGEIVEVLSAVKTAVVDTYEAGDSITYVISIVNTGAAPFNNLTVTDNLGTYTSGELSLTPLTYVDGSVKYYVNGVLLAAPTVQTAAGTLTFSGINVPAGGNAIIVYKADVNGFAPLTTTGTVENTATITGGGLSTPITADETVSASAEPVLSISKSVSPSSVAENGQLTYTFLIQNTGNTAAGADDRIVVTDTFTPILNDITVTYDGETLTETTDYTYDAATGQFSTVAGQLTVPAATYAQDPATGRWIVTPGVGTLTVTGTI